MQSSYVDVDKAKERIEHLKSSEDPSDKVSLLMRKHMERASSNPELQKAYEKLISGEFNLDEVKERHEKLRRGEIKPGGFIFKKLMERNASNEEMLQLLEKLRTGAFDPAKIQEDHEKLRNGELHPVTAEELASRYGCLAYDVDKAFAVDGSDGFIPSLPKLLGLTSKPHHVNNNNQSDPV